ncbi:MAG: GAF domain-containing protein, partial [Anaerolineae bacterium]|nr:GAF domain-containing protein [Anaerolineae bacterium]
MDDKDTIHQMMSQFADAVYSTEKEHNQLLKLLPKIQSIIGIKTIICSPLVFNDEVVGLLEISSKQHPKSQDITRLETVLKQIAAIFYRKHKEDELHLQVDQQQSLAVLSQALSESLDTQTMLRVALEQVLAITKVDGAECHLVDENSELALAATLGLDENFVAQSHDFRFPIGRGIPGRTFAARAPVYVPDATSDDRYWRKNLAQKAGYRSLLCIPIIAREIPFGTIMVYSRAAHDYYNHEKTILMAMGWQLAVALDRARFFDAEQQRAAELSRSNALISALGQVAARIDSTPDPNQIMATLGSELQGLGLKYIYLSLSPEIESLTVRYHSLPSEIITDLKKQFGMIVRDMQLTRGNCPYYEKLIDQKESVFLLDELSPNNPDFPPFLIAMINYSVKLNGLNSSVPVMILPLISDVRVVGVLIIWGATLQQEDLPAISIFASQLAASLEVAYLHEQLKIQRVTEQNILLNLSQTLNALNEPDEILTASAQIAQQTLQVELVAQLVPDPSNQRLVLRSGAGWQADMYGSFSMDMAASIEGRVMQTRQACQQIYSGTSPAHENPPELGRQGIESGLIVPLIAGDTALGVLCAYSYQPRQFSPDDVRLLSLIASNTAQALKRAELYWNTKRHAIELEFLADLSAGLRATSTTQQLID